MMSRYRFHLQRDLLLEHPQLPLEAIAGVAPVALGIEVTHIQSSPLDPHQCTNDFRVDEGFTAVVPLVVLTMSLQV